MSYFAFLIIKDTGSKTESTFKRVVKAHKGYYFEKEEPCIQGVPEGHLFFSTFRGLVSFAVDCDEINRVAKSYDDYVVLSRKREQKTLKEILKLRKNADFCKQVEVLMAKEDAIRNAMLDLEMPFILSNDMDKQSSVIDLPEYQTLIEKENALIAANSLLFRAMHYREPDWRRTAAYNEARFLQDKQDFESYKAFFGAMIKHFGKIQLYSYHGHEHQAGEMLPVKESRSVELSKLRIEDLAFLPYYALLTIS